MPSGPRVTGGGYNWQCLEQKGEHDKNKIMLSQTFQQPQSEIT